MYYIFGLGNFKKDTLPSNQQHRGEGTSRVCFLYSLQRLKGWNFKKSIMKKGTQKIMYPIKIMKGLRNGTFT